MKGRSADQIVKPDVRLAFAGSRTRFWITFGLDGGSAVEDRAQPVIVRDNDVPFATVLRLAFKWVIALGIALGVLVGVPWYAYTRHQEAKRQEVIARALQQQREWEASRLAETAEAERARLAVITTKEVDPNCYAPHPSLTDAPTLTRLPCVPSKAYLPALRDALARLHDGNADAARMMLEGGTAFAIDPNSASSAKVTDEYVEFVSNGVALFTPRPEYDRLVTRRSP